MNEVPSKMWNYSCFVFRGGRSQEKRKDKRERKGEGHSEKQRHKSNRKRLV